MKNWTVFLLRVIVRCIDVFLKAYAHFIVFCVMDARVLIAFIMQIDADLCMDQNKQ